MKRVLFVITKGEIGGAQKVVYNLAKGLKEKGIETTVGFGEGKWLSEKLKDLNIQTVQFRKLSRSFNPLANLLFIFEIRNFLNAEKFSAVHFHSSNALFGAIGVKLSKSRPKTIFTLHGLSLLDKNYKTYFPLKYLYRLIFKFLLFFIDKKIFICEANFQSAKKIKLAVPNDCIIYNGLDEKELKFLEKNQAREFFSNKIGIDLTEKFLIGSNGRLAYPKNYEFLIGIFPEILKVNKDILYIIISDGPERKKYENLIKEKNLKEKIFLLGEINDAYRYLKAFDLFILPSIYEGLSIALIEALFAGIPILASDVGGNKEIIPASEFQLYKLNDRKDFFEKFSSIAANEPLRGKLSSKNYLTSKKFIAEKMIKDHLDIYT